MVGSLWLCASRQVKYGCFSSRTSALTTNSKSCRTASSKKNICIVFMQVENVLTCRAINVVDLSIMGIWSCDTVVKTVSKKILPDVSHPFVFHCQPHVWSSQTAHVAHRCRMLTRTRKLTPPESWWKHRNVLSDLGQNARLLCTQHPSHSKTSLW